MIGTSLISGLVSILVFLGAGALVQLISWLRTKPVFDYSSNVVLVILIVLTNLIPAWGPVLAFLAAVAILFIPKVNGLYKLGAGAFILVLLLTLILSHTVFIIPL